jgi:phosphoglycerol transferase MdoB-like AlkP superfamily enzyme
MYINNFISHLIALLKRIGLILAIFTATRLLFLLFNWSYFQPLSVSETLRSFFFGIRFDFIPVFYLNILFILVHLFLFGFINKEISQKIVKGLIIAVNSLILLGNFIDMGYFGYTARRSGWEMIIMLFTSSDTSKMIPQYFVSYWYLLVLWILSILMLIRFYPKLKIYNAVKSVGSLIGTTICITLAVVLLTAGLIFARGIDTKPVRMITANKYISPKYIPLLINTPFTIINTFHQHTEALGDFFPLQQLPGLYSPVHKPKFTGGFKPMNVVLIILESFGKEYIETQSSNGLSFTPFFDSLAGAGLYCTNAYANAKRSMDAMPPLLGGFPSLLQTSFISSAYSVNSVRGLAAILKEENYNSSFFHGGQNGTMGFDMFCKSAGFDRYFGRKEYNNDKDYDGAWGIWDEDFFQFMAQNLDNFKQPFFSVLFSLSSHDPYPIPEKFKDRFFPDEPKIIRSIAYTDYSLRRFFETASHMRWFRNTLFVLCPDHTSIAFDRKYKTDVGRISIPIIYFNPSDTDLSGKYNNVTQQLDILPTILDYLNYPGTYAAYGKSIFSNEYRFTVSFNDINYQIIDSSYCLLFDGDKTIRLNNFKKDTLLLRNLAGKNNDIQYELEKNLKAFLQDYYYRLNTNRLTDTLSVNEIVTINK